MVHCLPLTVGHMIEEGEKRLIGEESFLMWGASCIFNPLRAPVNGWTPPEFH